MIKHRRLARFSGLLAVLSVVSCSKIVYEHNEGHLVRGTFNFMKNVFYTGQFEEEETPEKRNRAIVNDLIELDAVGRLATRKGILKDASYAEYSFRQQHARYGKAAIYHWQQKYKEKFNWQMLFSAEKLEYDEDRVAEKIIEAVRAGLPIEPIKIGTHEGKEIRYEDLRPVMTVSDFQQIRNSAPTPLKTAMREILKAWLEKKIHDQLVKSMFADETELKRFDHNRVSVLFLKVKYGKAGKGIYPGHMDKFVLKPVEIYDHYHKMQNALADVLWVKAAYTVVAEESQSEELMAKLDKGGDLLALAPRYASSAKYIETAKPHMIRGFSKKERLDDREKRDYYERLILDMAGRDVMKPEPYLGKDGIVIVRMYDVSRALEKVKLEDVSWKVENDLRTKMLNESFDIDVRKSREALKVRLNEIAIKRLK